MHAGASCYETPYASTLHLLPRRRSERPHLSESIQTYRQAGAGAPLIDRLPDGTVPVGRRFEGVDEGDYPRGGVQGLHHAPLPVPGLCGSACRPASPTDLVC